MRPQAWRNLAQDSQVLIALATPGAEDAARSWLVTVDSPPQMLDVQVDSLNTGRALLAGLAALLRSLADRAALAFARIERLIHGFKTQTDNSSTAACSVTRRPFRYRESVYFQDGQWLTGICWPPCSI